MFGEAHSVKVNIHRLDFPVDVDVSCSRWVGHQAERPSEGGVQMGRSSSLQGLGPLKTTLLRHYQVSSLTHFTGGEAHRPPHFTVTSLWELENEGNEELRE